MARLGNPMEALSFFVYFSSELVWQLVRATTRKRTSGQIHMSKLYLHSFNLVFMGTYLQKKKLTKAI